MSEQGLQATRVVGGIIPASLLARIQAGEVTDLNSLAPASYHLAGRETIGDAVSRAWSYLRGAWTTWREQVTAQPPGTVGTGAAREHWLLILLREFGYGHVPLLSGGYVIEDREYPISHAWQHVPIHLLGPGAQLDHRNPGVSGAARAPQAMVQELLNRDDDRLWAILSNGERLRLLRDSTALAGSAYLEFDLQAIFDGELFPEFKLMWQLCHVSRLEKRGAPDASPADCWLETWRSEAIEAGTRALDRLREGVEKALAALGTGFLKHPANEPVRAALHDGRLTGDHYQRALLRLVYRLLFCFVAEDRGALLTPDADQAARERYERYFSTARLRRLSRVRAGGPHGDLWQAQRLVLRALGNHGRPGLGLPGLAGLFDPDPRLPVIDGTDHPDLLLGCELANTDLLTAVRHLAWLSLPGRPVQPVDYRHLGAEELGSVYEALLELRPSLDLAHQSFKVKAVAGNERKTTGSYYTPPSLVSALLDTTLDPLLDDAVKNASDHADAERRLLALTVCDPACGSGHFLVAAARRIAQRLAQVRSGEEEPTPADVQHALRDVTGHCIYGVDLNDLAAELAKVSLWLEALEPGKPLGFLDARIRAGNSLLGTTPALLHRGVPEGAFQGLEGDDKTYAAKVRKRNKAEAKGQGVLVYGDTSNSSLVAQREQVLALADDVDEVRDQAHRWEAYEHSVSYLVRKAHADAWCAAFVWPLQPGAPEAPTNAVLEAIADSRGDPHLTASVAETQRLSAAYRFFHWHLEFPEIFRVDVQDSAATTGPQGWVGGFSCVVGNPPWELIELKEEEFFAGRDPEIANARNAAARKKMIATLAASDSPVGRALHEEYLIELRSASGWRHFLASSGRFPKTARGRINTYAVFAETAQTIIAASGQAGLVLPTGIATDATTAPFFSSLLRTKSLASFLEFENEAFLLSRAVHHSVRFCLLTMAGSAVKIGQASFAFGTRYISNLESRRFTMPPEEILLVNPNTGTTPIFRSRRDAEITIGIYRRVPVLWRDDPCDNPWGLSFMQGLFNMAGDSGLFRTRDQLEAGGWTLSGNIFTKDSEHMLPLYEAKMIHYFNHHLGTYQGQTQAQANMGTLPRLTHAQQDDPDFVIQPRYWVQEYDTKDEARSKPGKPAYSAVGVASRLKTRGWKKGWLLGWRDICRSTDERTVISAVIPRAAVGDKYLLAFTDSGAWLLQANLSAFVLDFAARQKFAGTSFKYFLMKQLPVLPPDAYDEPVSWLADRTPTYWIRQRVLELTYTAWDMEPFARDMGDHGSPFRWVDERRTLIRAELDAAYFHLYGLDRSETEHVMDSFDALRRREERQFGEYRTKRLILEVYDAMQRAIATGQPYQTILDPPPGHGPRHPHRSEAAA